MVSQNFTDEVWADQPGLGLKANGMGPGLRQGGAPKVSGYPERKKHQAGATPLMSRRGTWMQGTGLLKSWAGGAGWCRAQ